MKFQHREEDIKQTIREQIFPGAPEGITQFPLEKIMMGQIIKIDKEKKLKGCVFEVNENGLLAIVMHDFNINKAIGYHYFNFSDMQGIEVKEGMLFYKITMQFKDGRHYVMRVNKRDMKHFPSQHDRAMNLIDLLHDQNLRDMNSPILKKNVRKRRVTATLYSVTLMIFLITAMSLVFKYNPDHFFVFLVVIIGTALIHFILFLLFGMFFEMRKDYSFKKEFNTINKEYRETQDADQFLDALLTLRHQPTELDSVNAFNLSMSTALYYKDQIDEAMSYLDRIETSDKQLLEAIEEQRKLFEGKISK